MERAEQGETPWGAVQRWAERRGLAPDEADFLTDMIRELDRVAIAFERRRGRT